MKKKKKKHGERNGNENWQIRCGQKEIPWCLIKNVNVDWRITDEESNSFRD